MVTVDDLIKQLREHPGNMPVAVITRGGGSDGDLDFDPDAGVAISHPSISCRGTSWHWVTDDGPNGDRVLVLY
ncbi:MAG: hypothetical protein WAV90_11050 [Gordonia amarae]